MNEPNRPADEVEMLRDEAHDAGAAFRQTLDMLRDEVQQSFSAERIVRDHPWITLAASLAAGFAIGAVITPRKGEKLRERFESLNASGEDAASDEPPRRKRRRRKPQRSATKSGLAAMLITSLWGLMQSSVVSLLMAQLQRKPPQQSQAYSAAPQSEGVSEATTANSANASAPQPSPATASPESVPLGSIPPDLG